MSPNQSKNITLASLRQTILDLKADIELTASAGLPNEEVLSALRAELAFAMNGFMRIQRRVSDCLTEGRTETLDALVMSDFDTHERGRVALGGALAAYGLDRFMDEATEQANLDHGLRLTRDERDRRLLTLRRKLYLIEQAEEGLCVQENVARRADCNVAAVLGVPLEIAEENNLIGA